MRLKQLVKPVDIRPVPFARSIEFLNADDSSVFATLDVTGSLGSEHLDISGDIEFADNVAVGGDATFGDAVGDSVTYNAGTHTYPNATTFNFDTIVLDATAKGAECKGEWEFLNDLYVYGSMQFGLGTGDDVLVEADTWTFVNPTTFHFERNWTVDGSGFQFIWNADDFNFTGPFFLSGDLTVTGDATIGNSAGDSLTGTGDLWDLTAVTNVTIPDANAATEAMNRQTSDARYIELAGDTMGGALSVAVGTQSAPSLTFAGDTDVGFYHVSSNTMGAVANNVLIATFTEGVTALASRLENDKGGDIASADEITLGTDGNYFDVTGTTTINHINKTGWQAGSVVVLQFDGSVTVTHNSGTPAGTEASILLSGGGDFSATANDTLQLAYDGTTFREISRTVI